MPGLFFLIGIHLYLFYAAKDRRNKKEILNTVQRVGSFMLGRRNVCTPNDVGVNQGKHSGQWQGPPGTSARPGARGGSPKTVVE